MTILEVKNLSYSYPTETNLILKNISFSVEKNEFFSIVGPSGCGKTTLALCLNGLIPKSLKGQMGGDIIVNKKNIKNISTAELSQEVQILFQSPESQLFALNVEDEISFGLENLNMPWKEIESRVNEVLKDLEIENLRNRSIEELSSGQKQKVALASVLAMKPKVLILDEPTANLDPASVKSFLRILKNLKREMTIILIEHNINFVNEFSDRIMLMDTGKVIRIDKTEKLLKDKKFLEIMNPPSNYKKSIDQIEKKEKFIGEKILEIKNLTFSYPNKVLALKNINLEIHKGDFLGIVGLNGSGKSTLALNIIGLLKGKGIILLSDDDITKKDVYERTKSIGYVFQNPNYQLFEDNVNKEIEFGLRNIKLSEKEIKERVGNALKIINLKELSKEDPYSLSVGQKRRVTIASIFAMLPKIIIIDEPDTGLDYRNAKRLMDYIKKLNEVGHTIIIISHNIELIADYCNRVIYLEDGEIKNLQSFIKKIK